VILYRKNLRIKVYLHALTRGNKIEGVIQFLQGHPVGNQVIHPDSARFNAFEREFSMTVGATICAGNSLFMVMELIEVHRNAVSPGREA
jgi:hypothetical protein